MTGNKNTTGPQFERAVRLLANAIPLADETSRKPALFHDIRVGVYLYERGYAEEIVLAGLLHDAIEWYEISEDVLRKGFGNHVTTIICACTKDDSIKDPVEKIEKIIRQCVDVGKDALIVKTADIIDSFKWYTRAGNEKELLYCMRNRDAILRLIPDECHDEIFDELKEIHIDSIYELGAGVS